MSAKLEAMSKGERLLRMRHSASHVMAQAVLEIFPMAKWAIGPAIDTGFYYDFDLPRPLTPEDLEDVARRMQETVRRGDAFAQRFVDKEEARRIFAGQPYKIELIDGIADERVSLYQQGPFLDLCEGPHVERTDQIGAFKLMSVAGAYWRGDERRPMLQRIYGALFETQQDLDQHLHQLEEARRRDHRRLGRELGLFTSAEEVGAGLPLWLPKGAAVRRILETYIVEEERRRGYQHVYTPHLAKVELYQRSGHWDHYRDSMFPPMVLENEQLVLRPMNCPHHITIYGAGQHSYRELPVRLAELGTMYRYEKSGELAGLSRVRAMTLNDAHIFCRLDQLKDEFLGVLDLIREAYRVLGFRDHWYRLSLRDPADTEKYVQNDAMWDEAERLLHEAMDETDLEYVDAPGEASFYGPKLDVQVRNATGRDETVSTIQIDFHLPERFGLEYIGADGQPHRPVIIHRGVISTMERLMAFLIETYAGVFPVWLAPVQATFIPIADRHLDYARAAARRFIEAGLRVEVDDGQERMSAKIRNAQLQKVPYMLVCGDREVGGGALAVRTRGGQDLGPMPAEAVLRRLLEESKPGAEST